MYLCGIDPFTLYVITVTEVCDSQSDSRLSYKTPREDESLFKTYLAFTSCDEISVTITSRIEVIRQIVKINCEEQ